MLVRTRAIAAAAFAAVGTFAWSGSAAPTQDGPTDAICTIRDVSIFLKPGLSITPTEGTLNSHRTGMLECSGRVRGKEVTTGFITVSGTYAGSCATNDAEGLITVHWPTLDETESGMGRFDADTLLGAGAFTVTFSKYGTGHGALFRDPTGVGTDEPIVEGDCVEGVTAIHAAAGSLVFG